MTRGAGAGLSIIDKSIAASWAVTRTRGSVAAFHALALPEAPARQVWVHEPAGAALVLGSAQPDGVADAAALERGGVALVRRHSGGGAVLVQPGALTWVDVILPAGDPLWATDVGRSFHWLGATWARALGAHGVDADVHREALEVGKWGRLVCFAGRGPGEVVTRCGGPKLVGLSQRRTRVAARFQCAVLHRWEPAALVELLAMGPLDRQRATADLGPVAAGVPVASTPLVASFLAALPS